MDLQDLNVAVAELRGDVSRNTGRIKILETKNDAAAKLAESVAVMAELNALEADLPELPRITLPLDLDIRLSAGDIKCLEPFVTFEGADDA